MNEGLILRSRHLKDVEPSKSSGVFGNRLLIESCVLFIVLINKDIINDVIQPFIL